MTSNTIGLAAALTLIPMIAIAQNANGGRIMPPLPETTTPTIAEGAEANTRPVADRAWHLFAEAWRTGDWDPFLDMTTDDFQFYFPQGEFAGFHEGIDGKRQLVAWARYHQQAGNRLRSLVERATYAGDTAVFESTAESIPPGFYRNYEAVIFQIRGDRISALREYWNVLEPGTDPAGN